MFHSMHSWSKKFESISERSLILFILHLLIDILELSHNCSMKSRTTGMSFLHASLFSLMSKFHTSTKHSTLMYGREAVFPSEVPVDMLVSLSLKLFTKITVMAFFEAIRATAQYLAKLVFKSYMYIYIYFLPLKQLK